MFFHLFDQRAAPKFILLMLSDIIFVMILRNTYKDSIC